MQVNDAVPRAKAALHGGHFHAALWWASEALTRNPQAEDAKRAFQDSFVLASVSLPAIVAENDETVSRVTELMDRGNLTTDEAEAVAEAIISVHFAEELTNPIHPLLGRYNSDDAFRRAANIAKDDLDSVKHMAAALAGLPAPSGGTSGPWGFVAAMNASVVAEMTFAIQVERAALVILLQTNAPSDWIATCRSLSVLFAEAAERKGLGSRRIEAYKLLAKSFKSTADDVDIGAALFRKYRIGLETGFAKNAAHIKWLLSLAREPA